VYNSSKVQYIMNYKRKQNVFHVSVFVIKDDNVSTLTFTTAPSKVHETLPIGGNIIKSFRFL
jgi:hypothetical protein